MLNLQHLISGEPTPLTIQLFLKGAPVREQAGLTARVKTLQPNTVNVSVTMTFEKKTTYDSVVVTGDGVRLRCLTRDGPITSRPDETLTVDQNITLTTNEIGRGLDLQRCQCCGNPL